MLAPHMIAFAVLLALIRTTDGALPTTSTTNVAIPLNHDNSAAARAAVEDAVSMEHIDASLWMQDNERAAAFRAASHVCRRSLFVCALSAFGAASAF